MRIKRGRTDYTDDVGEGERYETEWEGLRLVIEQHTDYWQVFVYDPAEFKVLFTADRMNIGAAKLAAVEFASVSRFGPRHDLKPEAVAAMSRGDQTVLPLLQDLSFRKRPWSFPAKPIPLACTANSVP